MAVAEARFAALDQAFTTYRDQVRVHVCAYVCACVCVCVCMCVRMCVHVCISSWHCFGGGRVT